ncbi:MAG: peptidoglycan DD-metalloendopeptidase family protein [Zoogloeaceae bacterium]|nr:peptidoglycan DD-metalloendopeptidase family protein [Zoogloeaceae bacterium]
MFRILCFRLLFCLFVLAGALLSGPLDAPGQARQIADRQEDLKVLRARIESLREELAASEASRSDAVDQLRASERQISEAELRLFDLRQEKARLTEALDALSRQARDLEVGRARQQAQLGNLLYRQYVRGAPDPLRLMLNGGNPSRLTRDLHYLTVIAQARQALLTDARATLARQQALAAETRARADELAAVEASKEIERAKLLEQQAERRRVLTRIAGKMRAQKQEIGALERDEKRLARLIDRLTSILAEEEKKAATQRRSPPDAQLSVDENHYLPDSRASGDFARLKGRLRLPTRGEIVGRFGAAREGGGAWKGLYIRAPEGSVVRAIASGRVVYAEWMRGFGNLLIIDHGHGYLTVYGNNQSLLKRVGDRVDGGETVGAVGSSGGEQHSGLYFELRHQGRVLDPTQWISLK